jgi:hypothetical protein
MKLIAIKDLKRPRQFKRRLQTEKELLLTSDGNPVAILLNVETAEDPENILQSVRDARSRMALSRIRESARAAGTDAMSLAEINREISSARQSRKSRR